MTVTANRVAFLAALSIKFSQTDLAHFTKYDKPNKISSPKEFYKQARFGASDHMVHSESSQGLSNFEF